MRPRQDLVEVFSTFIQFEADCFSHWVADGRLRQSMQNCLKRAPDASTTESFWALYWYKGWQSADRPSSLPERHLTAYLQEACYWAAQQTVKKFTNIQYKLSDYFQMAIADLRTVLRDYSPDRGSSLKTYAGLAFPSLLRDQLRQRHETDICTNWTLLRKISKKRLLEALQHAGLSPDAIAQYRLAWVCFKDLWVPGAAPAKPSDANQPLWQAIADLYNQERQSQLVRPGTACTAAQIEQWLTRCAGWVRAYLYPPVGSLNAPKPGQESSEVQDDLPDQLQESLLAEAIALEEAEQRQSQRSQLSTVLNQALQQLDPQSQKLLLYYYNQGLTQKQIAQELAMTQVTVSRRLTKARETLLAALAEWTRSTLNISLTPNLIKDMSTALEEWLAGSR